MKKLILSSLLILFVVFITGIAVAEEEGIICEDGPGKADCCYDFALDVANQCLNTYEETVCLLGLGDFSAYESYCVGVAMSYCLGMIWEPGEEMAVEYCIYWTYPLIYYNCIIDYTVCMWQQYSYCQQSAGMAQNYCMAI